MIKVLKSLIAQTIIYSIFRPYYSIRTFWPVWFYVLNRQGRKLYQRHLSPKVFFEATRVINELEANGIALSHLDTLFPAKDMLSVLRNYAQMLRPSAKLQEKKPFLLKLWEFRDDCVIDFTNPYVRLALEPRVLEIVNGYMRMFSKFHYYSLNVTLPVTNDTIPQKSQRWHRDNEDKKMCKMFIYLNDVDTESGPFMYVQGTQHGGHLRHVLPPHPPISFYPKEGVVERLIPKNVVRICTAPAGTIIFCDTSGLHRGGYATGKERLMFTAEYSSPASFVSLRYEYPKDFKVEFDKLNPAGKFSITDTTGFGLRILNQVSSFSARHHLY